MDRRSKHGRSNKQQAAKPYTAIRGCPKRTVLGSADALAYKVSSNSKTAKPYTAGLATVLRERSLVAPMPEQQTQYLERSKGCHVAATNIPGDKVRNVLDNPEHKTKS